MRKQEIREGIASLTYQSCIDAGHKPRREGDYLPLAGEILSYLHSQNVVIKVDKECPECGGSGKEWGKGGIEYPCHLCGASGRIAIPLPKVNSINRACDCKHTQEANFRCYQCGATDYGSDMEEAGYVATEPLIETCPKCSKESHLCKCPTINRGSFAKYVEE